MHITETQNSNFCLHIFKFYECLCQITNFGRLTVLSNYTTQATYINPTIVRINFPTNSRSSSENTWGSGFNISLSYDAKHFGDSLVIIIYNDVCYSCNASTLECTNTVTKRIGLFSTMKEVTLFLK